MNSRKTSLGNKDFRSLNSRIKPKKPVSSNSYMPVNTIASSQLITHDHLNVSKAAVSIPKEIEINPVYESRLNMKPQIGNNNSSSGTGTTLPIQKSSPKKQIPRDIKVYDLFKIIFNPKSIDETTISTEGHKMTFESNQLKLMSSIYFEPNILATFKFSNIESIEYSYNDMDKINMVIVFKHPKSIAYKNQDIPVQKIWIFLPLYDRDSKKKLLERIDLMDGIVLKKSKYEEMKNKYSKPAISTISESNFYGGSSSSTGSSKIFSKATSDRLTSLTDTFRASNPISGSIATRKRPLRGVQIDYKGLEEAIIEDMDPLEAPKTAETLYELVPYSEQIVFQPSLHYKFDEKTKMTISNKDFQCLYNGNWVNDSIVDFFIRYSLKEAKDSGLIKKEKFETMSSFFYSKLSTEVADGDYYSNVKSWFKSNNNLFDNDYLIIPINVSLHWFCVVITNLPKLKRMHLQRQKEILKREKQEQETSTKLSVPITKNNEPEASIMGTESLSLTSTGSANEFYDISVGADISSAAATETRKYARIFILDSLKKLHHDIVAPLKSFLVGYAKDKYGFDVKTSEITKHTCSIPQQDNFNDCGLHVIYNLEQLFSDPYEFNKKILVDKKRKRNETILANKMFKDDEKKKLRETLRGTLVKLLKEEVEETGGDASKIGAVKNKDMCVEPINDKENIVYEESDDDEIVFIDEKINKPTEISPPITPTHVSSNSVKSTPKRIARRKNTEGKRANARPDNLTVGSSSHTSSTGSKSHYFDDKVSSTITSGNPATPKFLYNPAGLKGRRRPDKNLLSDDDYKGDENIAEANDNVESSNSSLKESPIKFFDDDDSSSPLKGHNGIPIDIQARSSGSITPELHEADSDVEVEVKANIQGDTINVQSSQYNVKDKTHAQDTQEDLGETDVSMTASYTEEEELSSQVRKDEARANDLIRQIDEEVGEKDASEPNSSEYGKEVLRSSESAIPSSGGNPQDSDEYIPSTDEAHEGYQQPGPQQGVPEGIQAVRLTEMKEESLPDEKSQSVLESKERELEVIINPNQKKSELSLDSSSHVNISVKEVGGAVNIPVIVSSKSLIENGISDNSEYSGKQVKSKLPTGPRESYHTVYKPLRISNDVYRPPSRDSSVSPRRITRKKDDTNYLEGGQFTDLDEEIKFMNPPVKSTKKRKVGTHNQESAKVNKKGKPGDVHSTRYNEKLENNNKSVFETGNSRSHSKKSKKFRNDNDNDNDNDILSHVQPTILIPDTSTSLRLKKQIPMSKTESPIKFSNEADGSDAEKPLTIRDTSRIRPRFRSGSETPETPSELNFRKSERFTAPVLISPITRINHILTNTDGGRSNINGSRSPTGNPNDRADPIKFLNGHIYAKKVGNSKVDHGNSSELTFAGSNKVSFQHLLSPSNMQIAGSSPTPDNQVSGFSSDIKISGVSDVNISGASDLHIAGNIDNIKTNKRERQKETDSKTGDRQKRQKSNATKTAKRGGRKLRSNHSGNKPARRLTARTRTELETESPSYEKLGEFSS